MRWIKVGMVLLILFLVQTERVKAVCAGTTKCGIWDENARSCATDGWTTQACFDYGDSCGETKCDGNCQKGNTCHVPVGSLCTKWCNSGSCTDSCQSQTCCDGVNNDQTQTLSCGGGTCGSIGENTGCGAAAYPACQGACSGGLVCRANAVK